MKMTFSSASEKCCSRWFPDGPQPQQDARTELGPLSASLQKHPSILVQSGVIFYFRILNSGVFYFRILNSGGFYFRILNSRGLFRRKTKGVLLLGSPRCAETICSSIEYLNACGCNTNGRNYVKNQLENDPKLKKKNYYTWSAVKMARRWLLWLWWAEHIVYLTQFDGKGVVAQLS